MLAERTGRWVEAALLAQCACARRFGVSPYVIPYLRGAKCKPSMCGPLGLHTV